MIYTGGTIGMRVDKEKRLDPLDASQFIKLLATVHGFSLETDQTTQEENLYLAVPSPSHKETAPDVYFRIRIVFVGIDKVNPVDSSLITPNVWADIASIVAEAEQELRYNGIVILHGTDTLAWTASALSFLLGDLRIPVVMTGSQMPLDYSRSDASRNLTAAIEFAAKDGCPKEVCILFDQVLLRGNRATKCRTSGFEAFETPNLAPLGTAGTELKNTEDVEELPPGYERADFYLWKVNVKSVRILVLKAYPGMELFPELPSDGRKVGIILEAYGVGTADGRGGLKDFLQRAKKSGAYLVLRTQLANGAVDVDLYKGSGWLGDLGISGVDITSEACVAKLYYLLGLGLPHSALVKALKGSLRGEVSLPFRTYHDGDFIESKGVEEMFGNHARYERIIYGYRHQNMLAERLGRIPGIHVETESQMNGNSVDIVASSGDVRAIFECYIGNVTRERAARAVKMLEMAGDNIKLFVVANGFTIGALNVIKIAGGSAVEWTEALQKDWSIEFKRRR